MISLRSLLLTSFTLCSSLPAWAQGQPVTRNQRSSGLTVRELLVGETTAAGGAPVMTVTSDPGAFYVLFSQFAFPSGLPIPLEGAQSLLVPATGPAVLGPLSLTSPAMVNSGLFTDPAGGAVGLIPASGFQDLNFGGPLPAFNLFAIELQALVFNNGVIEFSNAQIRQVIPTGALNPLGFTPGAPVASSSGSGWDDIEQGDVDGDGDLDMIGITQEAGLAGGSVLLWLAENGTYSPAPIVIAPGGQATSAELADFDGDGFLDLAVAYLANPAHLQIFANGGLIRRTPGTASPRSPRAASGPSATPSSRTRRTSRSRTPMGTETWTSSWPMPSTPSQESKIGSSRTSPGSEVSSSRTSRPRTCRCSSMTRRTRSSWTSTSTATRTSSWPTSTASPRLWERASTTS